MRKIFDILSVLLFFGVLAMIIAWMAKGLEEDYAGAVYVIDGDTVIIDQEKIRLEGIDAPELGQNCTMQGREYACGKRARNHLRTLVKGGRFHCRAWQVDKFERLLGQCFNGKEDVNAKMVRSGWALAFGSYQAEERAARQSGSGMWAGDFERPVDWRHMRGSVMELPHNTGKSDWWRFW